ncbi:hypothetical protein, partial [Atopobium sp. oral taxon 810]|uniref:hypothetical protein n=1 Tax=Atopobium sp. oral taxon 810 TaxID=712158 RepID=UPI0003961E98
NTNFSKWRISCLRAKRGQKIAGILRHVRRDACPHDTLFLYAGYFGVYFIRHAYEDCRWAEKISVQGLRKSLNDVNSGILIELVQGNLRVDEKQTPIEDDFSSTLAVE